LERWDSQNSWDACWVRGLRDSSKLSINDSILELGRQRITSTVLSVMGRSSRVIKISNFQLYSILVVFITPLAFLEIPGILARFLQQNAWMPVFLAIIPAYFLILIYNYILQHSQHPFPHLLMEHLGQPVGRILGLIYSLVFLLLSSYSLRYFTDFMENNVLPGTPISIHIGVLIVALVLGIRAGIGNLARLMEIVVICGVSFSLMTLLIIMAQQGEIERLLPLSNLNYNNLALATGSNLAIISRLFVVLTFGFWCGNKNEVAAVMNKAMLTYVLIIGLTTLSVLMVFGGTITSILTFPTFSMVTLINISNFIQNIDIIFIGIWILGIYGLTAVGWFMACYTLQIVFNLHDYRFLGAATALLVGIVSILISGNILELLRVTQVIIPILYAVFFITIPILLILLIFIKAIRYRSSTEHNMN
jgi:spore germination protein KB